MVVCKQLIAASATSLLPLVILVLTNLINDSQPATKKHLSILASWKDYMFAMNILFKGIDDGVYLNSTTSSALQNATPDFSQSPMHYLNHKYL